METEINEKQWNKEIDAWIEEQNSQAGAERPVDWPPDMDGLRGGLENKVVTADQITRYALDAGDLNPLWLETDYALQTRWAGLIGPPTFENCVGAPYDYKEIYKLPGFLTIMDTHISREYFTVIRPLDEFTGIDIYKGVTEESEPGKPYRRLIQEIQRTYRNHKHEKVVVVNRRTAIIVDAPGSKYAYRKEAFGEIKRHHYSQEELDEIYNDYDGQIEGKWRRGAEIRYWEDVTEGEEIHTLIAGPLDGSESLFLSKNGYAHSFAVKWAGIRQDLARAPVDPQTGEYRHFIDQYYKDIVAQEAGLPYAAGYSLHNESICAHAITDWMGDDGFVRRLDLKHEGMNFFGDTIRVKCNVSRKYIDGREHLVDIEVRSVCQDGRPIINGTATVRLLTRGD